MSQENVDLITTVQLGPDADVVALIRDESTNGSRAASSMATSNSSPSVFEVQY